MVITMSMSNENERQCLSMGSDSKTGFEDLDVVLGGLKKGDLYLLAARPEMGRTALALNIARHSALCCDKAIVIFSLEMSAIQMADRITLMGTGGNRPHFYYSNIYDESTSLAGILPKDTVNWGKFDLIINDIPAITYKELQSRCNAYRKGTELGLVVIDYLQLMSDYSYKEVAKNERLAYSLKKLAEELNVPVIVLSQMSRVVDYRPDHRPELEDLNHFGKMEQYADVVILLYRPGYYREDVAPRDLTEVIVAKNIDGATGIVKLRYIKECVSFQNYE